MRRCIFSKISISSRGTEALQNRMVSCKNYLINTSLSKIF